MISDKMRNEIYQLVDEGIELEIISEESGISLSELKQILLQYNRNKQITNMTNKRQSKVPKMQIIRDRYYSQINEHFSEQNDLSEDAKELIDTTINKILQAVDNFDELEYKPKKSAVLKVSREFDKIKQMPLTVEQTITILQCYEKIWHFYKQNVLDIKISNGQRAVKIKLFEVISSEADKTDSIEELKKLEKIILQYKRKTDLLGDSVEHKILNKISFIKAKESAHKIKYKLSPNVQEIVNDILKESIDLEKIRELIQLEIEEKTNNNSSGTFALKQYQIEEQIFMQIRTVIAERALEFPIKDPINILQALNELTRFSSNLVNMNAIIKNLCANKRYIEAKQIVSMERFNQRNYAYIRALKKDIACRELEDMILDLIKNPKTTKEEQIFIKTLEEKLKIEKINPKKIGLGTSRYTGRTVTLDDIWYDKDYRYK